MAALFLSRRFPQPDDHDHLKSGINPLVPGFRL